MAHRMVSPLLYINLSAEMMYIIEQRLESQNTDPEKKAKGNLIQPTTEDRLLTSTMELLHLGSNKIKLKTLFLLFHYDIISMSNNPKVILKYFPHLEIYSRISFKVFITFTISSIKGMQGTA